MNATSSVSLFMAPIKLPPGDTATYHGGNGSDSVRDVVESGAVIYLAGETTSTDLWFYDLAMQTQIAGGTDLFFATVNEPLDHISFQSLLGGSLSDSVSRISVAEGVVVAVGDTYSNDFPTTAGALSRVRHGETDAIVVSMWEDYHALIASTYLGGTAQTSEFETGTGVYYGVNGIYVTGSTNAADFPTTAGAFDTTFNDDDYDEAFVCYLDLGLSTLVY